MERAFRIALQPVIEPKTRAERAIRRAGLQYTIFWPGMLVGYWAYGKILVADVEADPWGVSSRKDVAYLMVAALFTPEAVDWTFAAARNPLLPDRGVDRL